MKVTDTRAVRAAPAVASPEKPKSTRATSTAKTADAFGTTKRDPRHWWKGRPLSEGRNAHKTNTVEQFKEAMKSGSNWLEADLRREQNPPYAIECRHDLGDERGDNLTLAQWLRLGVESGRGLKLDIKETQYLPQILKELEAAHVPSERLMIPAVSSAIPEIRRRFPDATLTIGPGGGEVNGKLTDAQVDRMLAQVKKTGLPAAFVVRYDLLTDSAIKRLSASAPVSVWNDPNQAGAEAPQRLETSLRARGVNGVIDIRKTTGKLDKAEKLVETGVGILKGKLKSIL